MKYRYFLATASTTLLLTSSLVATKPADKGKPTENESSYQYIEKEIKTEQKLLSEEDANEKAKLQLELAKEMQKKDGFNAESKEILGKYVKENRGSWKNGNTLPPGLQKKLANGGKLPTGWQKKLGVGDTIPKDIFDYSRPLPEDIANKIPHPAGTEDIMIEDEVYRISKKTRQIIDILGLPAN
ncbi:hypothetical protein [Cerasicoccus maritimus]|uniref:hypothetical protein n=1 Tax=Cerasicoccus maritimus TaxID=490089 RepID=UPI002852647A|nr:hypothetical protein [Cerasicoccus maritimus]